MSAKTRKCFKLTVFILFSATLLAYFIWILGVGTAQVVRAIKGVGEIARLELVVPLVGEWLFFFVSMLPLWVIVGRNYFCGFFIKIKHIILLALIPSIYLILTMFESFVWEAKAFLILAEMVLFVPLILKCFQDNIIKKIK